MKSRLFGVLMDDPESDSARAFLRHFGEVLALTDEQRKNCLAFLPRMKFARTPLQKKNVLEGCARELQISQPVLNRAFGVLVFLLDALLSTDLPEGDSALWAQDLAEVNLISEAGRRVLDCVVAEIRSGPLPLIRQAVRRRDSARGVHPFFEGCGITVEIRPVRKDFYRRGSDIESYRPEILDITLVASISIEVDEGTPEQFYFHADEEDIDYLINMLTAAKLDLAATCDFLGIARPSEGGDRGAK